MFPFGTPWKNQKTVMSSYVFRGSQMATLAQHRLEQDKPLTLTQRERNTTWCLMSRHQANFLGFKILIQVCLKNIFMHAQMKLNKDTPT